MKEGFKCCICKKWSFGWGKNREWGNNPRPCKDKGQCCDYCNQTKVIPARIKIHELNKNK